MMTPIEEIFEGLSSDESLSQETTDRILQVEQNAFDCLGEAISSYAKLKKENENLSASIKGMASGKVNLDKDYQDLEGLYGRLEKRWNTLKETFQLTIELYENDEDLDSANVSMSRQAIDEMNKLEQG